MMENDSHATILGVGSINLKFTSGKIVAQECAACPLNKEEPS
jgi:hypothetical protein